MTDDTILDFAKKKHKHIHNIHEKKLKEVHQAFERALPLTKSKSAKKRNKKKK